MSERLAQAQTEREDSLTVVNLLAVPSQNVVEIFFPVAFMDSLSMGFSLNFMPPCTPD